MTPAIHEISILIEKLKSSGDNLNVKLEIAEQLAQWCWYLSTEVGDAYEAMNMAEYFYKSALSKYEATEEGSAAKLSVKAKHENTDKYRKFVEADNYYKKLQLLRDAVMTTIEQTRQSISYLKQEKIHSR
jgi:hypothetical protein